MNETAEADAYEWLREAKELGHQAAREILEISRENGRRLPLADAIQKSINSPSPVVEEFKRRVESPAGQEIIRRFLQNQ